MVPNDIIKSKNIGKVIWFAITLCPMIWFFIYVVGYVLFDNAGMESDDWPIGYLLAVFNLIILGINEIAIRPLPGEMHTVFMQRLKYLHTIHLYSYAIAGFLVCLRLMDWI